MIPLSGDSSPRIIRINVVLPTPFGPTSPVRVPGRKWADASCKQDTGCKLFTDAFDLKHGLETGEWR